MLYKKHIFFGLWGTLAVLILQLKYPRELNIRIYIIYIIIEYQYIFIQRQPNFFVTQ